VVRRIEDEVAIEAPIEAVWTVLTDFAAHADWNPFLAFERASTTVGERLRVRVSPPGTKARTVEPVLTACDPPTRYEWLGRVGMPGLLDARHRFGLGQLAPGRTRLRQEEVFSGVLAPLLPGVLRRTEEGFRVMHAALKERVESGSGGPPSS
jgi:hypothetical protein